LPANLSAFAGLGFDVASGVVLTIFPVFLVYPWFRHCDSKDNKEVKKRLRKNSRG
jgi:hypothetical protein